MTTTTDLAPGQLPNEVAPPSRANMKSGMEDLVVAGGTEMMSMDRSRGSGPPGSRARRAR